MSLDSLLTCFNFFWGSKPKLLHPVFSTYYIRKIWQYMIVQLKPTADINKLEVVMAIIRFQPLFNDIELIRRQMDQIFDNMVGSVQGSETWQPAIELKEADDELVLRVELPGIEGKDLDVQVRRDAVVISGETTVEKTENKETYIRSEFRYGKFQRAISLPVPIQNDQVKANFTNGVLTLNMPKHEAVKNTVVKLNFGENQPILDASENRA